MNGIEANKKPIPMFGIIPLIKSIMKKYSGRKISVATRRKTSVLGSKNVHLPWLILFTTVLNRVTRIIRPTITNKVMIMCGKYHSEVSKLILTLFKEESQLCIRTHSSERESTARNSINFRQPSYYRELFIRANVIDNFRIGIALRF